MNVENLRIVRDTIALLPPERFNMATWGGLQTNIYAQLVDQFQLKHDCGTCGCIGGWAQALLSKKGEPEEFEPRDLLGLTSDEAEELFYPRLPNDRLWNSVTIPEAVKVLDHLIETGKVDWSII